MRLVSDKNPRLVIKGSEAGIKSERGRNFAVVRWEGKQDALETK
jgi:hypothetical protein